MGEATEDILEGRVCQNCGEWIDAEGDGIPASCNACADEIDDWDARREQAREHKADRRLAAGRDFQVARTMADSAGLILFHKTDTHFQLTTKATGGWLLNLYPGNCRVYGDRNRPKGPFLNLAGVKWTLVEVVRRACERHATEKCDG